MQLMTLIAELIIHIILLVITTHITALNLVIFSCKSLSLNANVDGVNYLKL